MLLVETEGRQGIAQLFDTPPLPYEERRVAVARGHGEVKALAIDVEEALLDYLDMFYNLRRAGRALRKMGAIDFATAIAPGLRDVLITGKIKEAVTRRHDGRPVYDAVVVDAPPTGRITRFLGVTAEMSQLARSGPIKTQSDGVMAVLRSPQTAVHLVTLLEDMPVQETADAIAELTAAGLPVGSVVVNMATEPVLPADELARAAGGLLTGADLAPALEAAHLPGGRRARRRAGRGGRRARPPLGLAGRPPGRRRGAGPADRRAAAAWPGRWTSAPCSSRPAGSRTTCARRGRRVSAAEHPVPRPRRPRPALAAPMDLAALIADPETRILVCCGAGGVGKTTTSAALALAAAEAGRTVVVLTIDPARRLAQSLGLVELDNEPRRVDVPGADGRTARDDAGHEAHVRRHRRGAFHARAGGADPRQSLLPVAVLVLRRDAGVHGDGEAGPAAGDRAVGPDHRRHPAVAIGAGLPRRPEPDEPLPRRPDDPAAHRRPAGRA